MELWPKPMTAARLVENALENIKTLRPVPDPAAAFAELNAMLDKLDPLNFYPTSAPVSGQLSRQSLPS